MIAVSDLGKSFGAQTLFEGVSIQFNPGNRYGLVGANGSGKSTLLRILAGEEAPSSGIVSIPKKLRLGVLKQDHFRYEEMPIVDVAMMGNREVWEAMAEKERLLHADSTFESDRYAQLEDVIMRYQGYSLEARAAEILEGLGIPTEVHRSPLSTLSGGFKLRVLLGQVLAADPGALLLDEPTNHLDIEMREALAQALQDFEGTLIVVALDRHLLEAATDQWWLVADGRVAPFDGNLDDYREWSRQYRARGTKAEEGGRGGDRRAQKRAEAEVRQKLAEAKKPFEKRIAGIERELAVLLPEKESLDAWLASGEAYGDGMRAELAERSRRHGEVAARIAQLEEDWLWASAEMEAAVNRARE